MADFKNDKSKQQPHKQAQPGQQKPEQKWADKNVDKNRKEGIEREGQKPLHNKEHKEHKE